MNLGWWWWWWWWWWWCWWWWSMMNPNDPYSFCFSECGPGIQYIYIIYIYYIYILYIYILYIYYIYIYYTYYIYIIYILYIYYIYIYVLIIFQEEVTTVPTGMIGLEPYRNALFFFFFNQDWRGMSTILCAAVERHYVRWMDLIGFWTKCLHTWMWVKMEDLGDHRC